MNDRFLFGFISGIIAHIFQAIFSVTLYSLKVSDLRFRDFSAILTYGHKPMTGLESLFAEFVAMIFSGFLAIIFVYLVPVITSKYYYFKACLFGVACWSLIYAIVILFKVPGLNVIPTLTTIINIIGSLIYGLALGIVSKKSLVYLIKRNYLVEENMKDKVFFGFVCGVIAYIFQAIISISMYFLNISALRFQDFTSVLMYGYRPKNTLDSIFAELALIMLSGILGVALAYLFPRITYKYYAFKGWLFSTLVWFFIASIMILFDVQAMTYVPVGTAFVNFVGASVFGIVLGIAEHRILANQETCKN